MIRRFMSIFTLRPAHPFEILALIIAGLSLSIMCFIVESDQAKLFLSSVGTLIWCVLFLCNIAALYNTIWFARRSTELEQQCRKCHTLYILAMNGEDEAQIEFSRNKVAEAELELAKMLAEWKKHV